MKHLKLICLLLAAVLVLSACGGGQTEPSAESTAAPTTETTVPPTTEAIKIVTEEILKEALALGGMVIMEDSITLTSEAVIQGGYLDGSGYTLTAPVYVEGEAATENGITIAGGTVEDVTVYGAYRGIGDSKDYRSNQDIRLNNVVVDGGVYTLNFGYGNGSAGLYATGCTLNGWTSYTKLTEAIFTDCTFGWGDTKTTANLRPYIDTVLTGCRFEGKTEANGTYVPFNIMFKADSAGITLTLEDCYAGDTLITEENLNELLHVEAYGNTIQIRNTAN